MIAPLDDLKGDHQMAMKRERVQIGEDAQGKPLYKWASGDGNRAFHESIARIFLENGLLQGITQPSKNDVSFRVYASEWFSVFKQPNLRYTTMLGYKTNLEKHLYPEFGHKMMNEISTSNIQSFLNRLSEEGKSKSTVHKNMILLHQIFTSALEDDVVSKNPMDSERLSNPSDKEEKRDALESTQIKCILNDLDRLQDPQERMLLALLVLTGMRRGEALGLMWEDIGFGEKLIQVSRAVTFQHNKGVIGLTKSEAGIRSIPLLPQLEEILSPMRSTGLIIHKDGDPITEQTFRRMWERIKKKVNLFGATPHILRHSFATILSNAGIDVKTIQTIVGHADISTTMETYVHSQTKQVKLAGSKLVAAFTTL
jgi:site-specific recombinase XerD